MARFEVVAVAMHTARKTPTDRDILGLARKYGRARRRYIEFYNEARPTRGLDRFGEKYRAWECKLFKAEEKKSNALDALSDAILEWVKGS